MPFGNGSKIWVVESREMTPQLGKIKTGPG